MNKTFSTVLPSVLATGVAIASSAIIPTKAQAFDFNLDGSIDFDNTMVGNSFIVDFDGSLGTNAGPQELTNMNSVAEFTWQGFDVTSGNALFNVNLKNTSDPGLTSRTSVLGFDVNPDIDNATSSGDFENVALGSALPNQFGSIEVCFKDANAPNCQGGGSGGALSTDSDGIDFQIELIFDSNPNSGVTVTTFTLDNWGVRYQSINGTGILADGSTVSISGGSGTGSGTPTPPTNPPGGTPTPIPEPSSISALALLAGALQLFRRHSSS